MSSSAQLANAVQGARAVAAQGDVRGAYALLDQALDAATTTLGVDDPDVLSATGLLARLHTDLGELPEARRVLEEGLAAGYHRLGDGHAVMLGLAYELARIADELGNVYEAKRRYGQLARLGPNALGDDHPSVQAARRYLGLPEPQAPMYIPAQAGPATFDPLSPPAGAHPAQTWPVEAPRSPQPAPVTQPSPAAYADQPIFRPESRDAWTVTAGDPEPWTDAEPQPAAGDPPGAWLGGDPDPDGGPDDGYQPVQVSPAPPRYAPEPAYTDYARPISGAGGPWPDPPQITPGRRRSPLVALLVIVIIALLGGITAAVVSFVAARPGSQAAPPAASQQPIAAASTSGSAASGSGNPSAPTGVRLRDDRTAITLTWTDPSKGTVPFIIAGGQQGALRQLQVLAAGSTTYTINGLNPKLQYCFTVAAVYDTNRVELSDLTCTKRG